ncbi:hypothetical protein [Dysgonomonas sp. 520]|uniref:hypothetical protein n=1 Tax=Dysgonomonas sp. 520 TaxID=2302931 RepID=UPI0013D55B60|nr:hypothetical protein [Dysgonomonas sp. 520]
MLKQLFVRVAYLRCVGTLSISQMSRLRPSGRTASALPEGRGVKFYARMSGRMFIRPYTISNKKEGAGVSKVNFSVFLSS